MVDAFVTASDTPQEWADLKTEPSGITAELRDEDRQMAVHGFFAPAELLEFVDLTDASARTAWAVRHFGLPTAPRRIRRVEGEPDAGASTCWTPDPAGFTYEVQAPSGTRAGRLSWTEVHVQATERLTPVRYGALRQAVEVEQAHAAAYTTCPLPYRTAEAWNELFYRSWSRRSAALSLRSTAALNAIVPAAVAHPPLF
ncbi:hypothetical protein OEIGOIKO_03457 [Streptomyces chrestomyceticus JCM 4735]|uniref:Uncharacterized protein n=1 Tax=Streptomyces chrestomyceticus JCM 4735 TaxID=1306181 RepID=A0A7U9KUU1_9ACTN|nr:hypothetical protein [Streptomyces chrestomyceticus]GCD35711.1 hypothetical protein OEIGOIKO_03457 [Streptomyces chrestomyceticus JCM 4735]